MTFRKIAKTSMYLALLLPCVQLASAQDEGAEPAAGADQEYQQALELAEIKQQAASAAVEAARAELQRQREELARQAAQLAHETAEARRAAGEQQAAQSAEREAMRAELRKAYEELRQASREVARAHRELNARGGALAPGADLPLHERAVIGVILGSSDARGVEVLGLSPDGPAERAGLQSGDRIVAIMGQPLAKEGEPDPRAVLQEVMQGVQPGDELALTVERDGDSIEYRLTAEQREPFAWQNIVRLPSAPRAPGETIVIERIEVPEIDTEALARDMERLRAEIDRAGVLIHKDGDQRWEYEFHHMSELAEDALSDVNVWFGMPLTRGLKLAEVDPDLGAYFKTDRGVLVLKAREDNKLQLETGDVILSVGGTAVNRPADVLRALRREFETGAEIEIEIKRERKSKTLAVTVPEGRLGMERNRAPRAGPPRRHSHARRVQ